MGPLEIESISQINRLYYGFRSQTRLLYIVLALLAVMLSARSLQARIEGVRPFSSSSSGYSLVSNAISRTHPIISSKTVAPAVATASATKPMPPSLPSVPLVAAPQACAPDTTYVLPAQLNLSNDANGFTQSIDATSHYTVYGNTTDQILAQLRQCAPLKGASASAGGGNEFTAQTGYSLAWQYGFTVNADGSCSIANAKVGLHVNMVLPQWQPSPSAANGLNSAWQQFISGLTTHENGHVAIDQQYSQQLLSDLQSYPETDCGSIAAGVQAKISADSAALNAANDAYDAQTNHGITQGAVL